MMKDGWGLAADESKRVDSGLNLDDSVPGLAAENQSGGHKEERKNDRSSHDRT
jgi:hypothetical protein